MSERLNQDEPEFDVLGDVLSTLRFRGSIFFRSELAAPWGISLPHVGIPRFHIAMSGDCFIGAEGEDDVKVEQMEIVMLPRGQSHWIADQPGRELIPSERAGEACELNEPLFQQGEITQRIICGLVHFDQESTHPILDSLPHVMHFPNLSSSSPVWMTITLLDTEMHRSQTHSGPIVDRLTEVLFMQLLLHHVNDDENNQQSTGFLVALRDRHIHHALKLIHREPNYDWTLSSLGERVGMSRATLVRHFKESVGVAPMTYINNWRIMKAYSLVKYSSVALERIAGTVGFASARTLTKAFARQYGCTPNELRRQQDPD